MNIVFTLVMLLLGAPAFADQCAFTDNELVCVNPPGCGYVNGIYTCTGDAQVHPSVPVEGNASFSASLADLAIGPPPAWTCNWYDPVCVLGYDIQWLWYQGLTMVRATVHALFSGAASVVESLPVPDAFAVVQTSSQPLIAKLGYLLVIFKIPQGLSLIMGAYILRFLLRRIPFVG